MSEYYDKYIKYKKKYLEIQNKISEIKKQNELNNQFGGKIINHNLLINFISPHHRYLINNLDILSKLKFSDPISSLFFLLSK